jgi:hypothetical protein
VADVGITWDLIVRDRASAQVGRVGDEVESLTSRVGRLAAAFGGAFAFQQAGAFALKMADQFELSRSRLETITKNVGGSFAAISSQVNALDNRLATFGFTNADVEGAVASLTTATHNSAKAMQDVALAADIARGRNISLEESTRILMRVETGHVAMLSKLGIQTKDATGHILTQQEALQALAATYGGSASHYAGTFAGKQAALRAELANSAAEIGAALLPAAVDLVRVLQRDILPAVQATTQWFDRNRRTIEPLIGTIIKLTLAYKAFRLVQNLAGSIGASAVRSAAQGAAISEAASLTRPIPVFVVNMAGKYPMGGGPVTTAETATTTESRFSRYGRGALEIASVLPFAAQFGEFWAKSFTKYGIGPFHWGQQKQIDPEGNLAPGFRKQVDALGGIDKALAYYQKLNLAASWEKKLDGSTKSATLSLKDQATALADLQTKSLALSQGQDDLRQAVHNMAVVVGSQSSRQLKGNSDAALANRDALRGAVQAAEGYLQALTKHGASAAHVHDVEVNLARAIKQSSINTYGDRDAVVALLGQLGFLPSQIDAVTAALINMQQAWNPITGSEHAGLSDFGNLPKKGHDAGAALAKSLVGGYTPVVSKGVTAATSKVLNSAAQQAKQEVQTVLSYFTQTKQSLLSGFASLSSTAMTDSLGGSYNRAESIRLQLKHDAQQAHIFSRLYVRLAKAGLDPRILSQFTSPDFIPAMRELLQGGKVDIQKVNRFERQISHDLNRVAQVDTLEHYGPVLHHDLKGLPKAMANELRRDGLTLLQLDRLEGRKVRGGG